LGGNSDGSFLEGHSYTYEGSSWGKIVQILMECKSMNPVIYFDELDKVSDTPRGEEIIGILTHLTDISQNTEFHDKYFSEFSFDLSKCLFIFSYNDESKVNPILKDRMYRVETKGYSNKEKMIIAKDYLLPKIRKQVNFKDDELIISEQAIDYLITNAAFTMNEDGVRNLKRCLEVIHTKLNLCRLVTPENKNTIMDLKIDVQFPFTVTKDHIDSIIKKNDSINPSLFGLYV
jgi:ATP-dependent Lon protease